MSTAVGVTIPRPLSAAEGEQLDPDVFCAVPFLGSILVSGTRPRADGAS